MTQRFRTFDEFWPHYVRAHSKKLNRQLHFVGSTAALVCVAGALITKKKWLLAAAPIVGYGCAWIGHFGVEGNKPATFGHPVWSFAGDWIMWAKTIAGTMDAEVEKHTTSAGAEAHPTASTDPTVN